MSTHVTKAKFLILCLLPALSSSLVQTPKSIVKCPESNAERDSSLTITLPDPETCSHFYMCVRSTPVLMSCPPGLHFYERDARCDFPETVKCTKEDPQVPTLLSREDDSDCRQTDPRAPIEGVNCPPVGKQTDGTVILFKDPHSCHCFYKCHRGLAYRLACPVGLHYNEFLKVCDFPAGANCEPYKAPVEKNTQEHQENSKIEKNEI